MCLCDSGQHPLRRSVGTANERREEEEEEEEEDAVPTNGSETVQDASVVTTSTAGLVGGPGLLHFLPSFPLERGPDTSSSHHCLPVGME